MNSDRAQIASLSEAAGGIAPVPLTKRQIEALQFLSEGKTVRDAAELMGLSHYTVQTYVRTAFQRTNAFSITHLVAIALRNGWIK